MRRAIVHIGTPRTGTTTLQRVLSRRRAALEAAGVLYPDLTPARAEPHLSHQYLGEALAGRRSAADRAELLGRLDTMLGATACDVVVLSYESLCLIPAAFGAPRVLEDLFARHGMAMEVLLTVKPQTEYLNSIYTWRMQFLREGRLFPAFLRANLNAREFDYMRLIAPWQAAAPGPVTAVPLRDATSDAPHVERVFVALGLAERFGAAIDTGDLGLRENRSPGPVAVEVCRRLRAGGAGLALGARAREATRMVEQAAEARGCDRATFTGIDEALRALVEARWAIANDAFAGSVWGAPWSSMVSSGPARAPNEIARLPVASEVEAHVQAVLNEISQGFRVTLHGPAAVRLLEAAALPGALVRQAHRQLRGLLRA